MACTCKKKNKTYYQGKLICGSCGEKLKDYTKRNFEGDENE